MKIGRKYSYYFYIQIKVIFYSGNVKSVQKRITKENVNSIKTRNGLTTLQLAAQSGKVFIFFFY